MYVPSRCNFCLRRGEDIFLRRGDQTEFWGECKFFFYQRSSSSTVHLPYKVVFYLKSPIFILQRAYIPKNGVEFRQHTNSDNRTGVATSCNIASKKVHKQPNGQTNVLVTSSLLELLIAAKNTKIQKILENLITH